MSEDTTPIEQEAPEAAPEPETPPREYVGILKPGFGFELPHLIDFLIAARITTAPVTRRDNDGNYLAENGELVVPAPLANHVQLIPLDELVAPPAEEPAES